MATALDKQKVLLISVLSGVGMTAAIGVVLANAHIDIFPCTETVRERDPADPWASEGKLVTKDATCSLMDQLNTDRFDSAEKSELTGAGWAMVVLITLGAGIGDALLLHTILGKRVAKA